MSLKQRVKYSLYMKAGSKILIECESYGVKYSINLKAQSKYSMNLNPGSKYSLNAGSKILG